MNTLPEKNFNLIPTDEVIEIAKDKGVYFGPGDPKNRIRYLIKKGLLPYQIRKQKEGHITSYLPEYAIERLVEIQRLQDEKKYTIPKVIAHFKDVDTNVAPVEIETHIPQQEIPVVSEKYKITEEQIADDRLQMTEDRLQIADAGLQKAEKDNKVTGYQDIKEKVEDEKVQDELKPEVQEKITSKNSDNVRQDIKEFFTVPAEKLSTIPLPKLKKIDINVPKINIEGFKDGIEVFKGNINEYRSKIHETGKKAIKSTKKAKKPALVMASLLLLLSLGVISFRKATNFTDNRFTQIVSIFNTDTDDDSRKSAKNQRESKNETSEIENKEVANTNIFNRILGAATEETGPFLNINIPSFFNSTVDFNDTVIFEDITTYHANLEAPGQNLNLGDGQITASNVIYSLTAGDGITITGGQNAIISADVTQTTIGGLSGEIGLGGGLGLDGSTLTNTGVLSLGGESGDLELEAGEGIAINGLAISNTDTGSAQSIFKNFIFDSNSITASSNNDTLTFIPGSGIGFSVNGKEVTITNTENGYLSWSFAVDGTTFDPLTDGDILNFISGRDLDISRSADDQLTFDLETELNVNSISALTASGLALYDDGNNLGIFIEDGGNVGIGTANPDYKLDVEGNIRISNTTNPTINFYASNTATSGAISMTDAGLFQFPNGSIDANSINILNVGTSSPTISSISGLEVSNNGLSLIRGCNTGQVLKWNQANLSWECANDTGAEFAVVSVQNNDVSVGVDVDTLDFSTDFILTASPSNEANISIADDALNYTELSDTLALDANTSLNLFGGSAFDYRIFNSNSSTDSLFISGANGNVGIGTTAPAYKLDVNGTLRATGLATFDSGFSLDNQTFTSLVGTGLTNPGGTLQLATSGVTANTYGGVANIPVITVDQYGRITSASNQAISYDNYGSWNLSDGTNSTAVNSGGTASFVGGVGIGTTNVGGTITINNNGVLSLTGTTNQINVSASTGNITLSLPQNIHTDATPTFNSIILDSLSTGTDNTVLIVDGSGNVLTDEIDSRVWGNTLLDTSHIGVTVQGFDSQLSDISGLTPTDGGFIVGNGTNFVLESGNTARTSLGLGTGDIPTFAGLGIGSTNPAYTFNVAGSTNITSTLNVGGATTLGGTLTFNSETFNDLTGDGLTNNGGALAINLATGSGLEFSSGQLSLLRSCAEDELLQWDGTEWVCSSITGAGGITKSGTPESGYVSFWSGANSITGVSSLYYDSAQGYLGIGTTSPSSQLFVNGRIDATEIYQSGNQVCDTSGNCVGTGGGGAIGGSGTTNFIPKFSDSFNITSSLIFDNGTNVGVGNTDPQFKLHVDGSFGATSINLGGHSFSSLVGAGLTNPGGTLQLATTGASAGSYGDSTNIPVLTVDEYGRITAISNQTISYDNYGSWNISDGTNSTAVNSGGSVSIVGGLGIGTTNVAGAITITNNGVLSLTGTANQVNVSDSTGAITLSLPQDIHTSATPTFGGLNIGAIGIGDTGSSNITSGASLIGVFDEFLNSDSTNVQDILDDFDSALGSATHDAVTLAGSYDYLTLNNQEITLNQIDLTTDVTGTLPVGNGGTGLASYTAGDLLFASGSSTLSKLGIGANGYILSSNGTSPQWLNVASWDQNASDDLSGSGTSGYVSLWNGTQSLTNSAIFQSNNNLFIGGTAPATNPAMFISTNSYVGIGNTSPVDNLYITRRGSDGSTGITIEHTPNDSVRIAANGQFGLIDFGSGLANGGRISTSTGSLNLSSASELIFRTNGSVDALRIDSAQQVGIGTTAPSALFDVAGNFTVNSSGTVSLANGTFLDLSNITHSTTTPQGLRLPNATALNAGNAPASGAGYIAYDLTDSKVKVFNGSNWTDISGASTTLQEAYEAGNTVQLTAGEGNIRFYNDSGNEMLFLQEATGYLGISTTAPSQLFDIAGNFTVDSSGNAVATTFNNLSITGNNNALTLAGDLTTSGGGDITLTANGNYTLTIPATGTAALGTGTANYLPYWSDANTLSDARIYQDTNFIGIGATPNTHPSVYVHNNGRVGIGTTNPSVNLEINGDTHTSLRLIGDESSTLSIRTDNTSGTRSGQITFSTFNNSTKARIRYNHLLEVLELTASSAGIDDASLFLGSEGNVGIGTTEMGTYKLNVNGSLGVGSTATFNSALTFNSETFTDFTGNGLTNSSGALAVNLATGGGLEFTSGQLSLLQSCNSGELLQWNGTSWTCTSVSGAGGITKTGSPEAGYITFWSGSNAITGNTNLFYDSVNGFLGLGTTAPTSELTLNGSFEILDSTGNSTIFNTSGAQTQNITYTLPNDDGSSNYVLSTDGNGVLSWTSVTGVGAGTGTITAVGNITSGDAFTAGTPGSQLYFANNGFLGLGTTAARINFIDGTTDSINLLGGNVGIGTTAPTALLSLNGGTGSLATGIAFGDGDTGIYENADDSINFSISNSDRWRMDSGRFVANGNWGPILIHETPTYTNPTVGYNYNDTDTGLGGSIDGDTLSLIAGGVNILNAVETGGIGYIGIGTTSPQYTLDINGDARIASGSDLYIGTIGLGTTGATSGASLVGVFDEFTNSDGVNVQEVLADFDSAIGSATHDAVTLAGSYDYLTLNNQQITLNQIDLTTDVTGTLPVGNGGTGLTTYTQGDLLYGNSSNGLSTLGIGANGYILSSNGTAPQWVSTTAWDTNSSDDLTGSGTSGYVSLWNGTQSLTNSAIFQNGNNVGIGLTNPSYLLQVGNSNGSIGLNTDVNGNSNLYINGNVNDQRQIQFQQGGVTQFYTGVGDSSHNWTDGNDFFIGRDFNNPDFIIDGTTGNVGIGTTSPAATLLAVGPASSFTVDTSGNAVANTYNTLSITGNNNSLTVNSDITLAGGGNTLTLAGNLETTGGGDITLTANGNYTLTIPATGTAALGTGTANYLPYWSNTNTLANSPIFTNGTNVGIGTTSPSYLLDINGTLGVGGTATFNGALTFNSETFTDFTGNGLTNSSGSLALNIATDRGLEIDSGQLSLITSCSDNQVLAWDADTETWGCITTSSGLGGSGAAGQVSFWDSSSSLNGNFDFFWDTANSRLGIGTSAPSSALTLNGSFEILDSSGYSTIFSTSGAQTQNIAYTLPNNDGDNNYVLTTDGNGVLSWTSVTGAGAGTGTITAVGNITSGDAFTAGTPGSQLYFANNSFLGLGSNAGRINFIDDTTDKVAILDANVGIGTTNPGANLVVDQALGQGSSYGLKVQRGTNAMSLYIDTGGTNTIEFGNAGHIKTSGNDASLTVSTGRLLSLRSTGTTGSEIDFYTENTKRMVIERGGNVGIGTTNPETLLAVGPGNNFTVDSSGNAVANTYNTLSITGNNSSATFNSDIVFDGSGHTLALGGDLTTTGGGDISLLSTGNYTLTIPATGTAALGTGTAGYLSYWNNTNTLANSPIFTNGTNVGIGTTAPSERLTVNGNINLGTNKLQHGSNNYLQFTGNAFKLNTWASGSKTRIDIAGDIISLLNSNVGINTQSAEAGLDVASTAWLRGSTAPGGLYVNNLGNVGIGTTNPSSQLVLTGNSASIKNIDITTASGQTAKILNISSFGETDGDILNLTPQGVLTLGHTSSTLPDGQLHIRRDDTTGIALKLEQDRLSGPNIINFANNANQWYMGMGNINQGYSFMLGQNSTLASPYLTVNTSGNVGIGTTNPQQLLSVNGRVNLLDVGTTASGNNLYASGGNLYWGNTQINTGFTGTIDGTGTANYVPRFSDENTLTTGSLYDNGTNIGVGTTNPTSKLHVAGEIRSYNSTNYGSIDGKLLSLYNQAFNRTFSINNSGPSTIFNAQDDNHNMQFQTNSVTRLFISNSNNNGYVGIGTTNPQQLLSVNGRVNLLDVGSTASGNNLYANGTDLYWGNTLISSGGDASLASLTSGYVPYYDGSNLANANVYQGSNFVGIGRTANTYPTLYVGNNGNVGIGTTNPAVNLEIKGDTHASMRLIGDESSTLSIRTDNTSGNRYGQIVFSSFNNSVKSSIKYNHLHEYLELTGSTAGIDSNKVFLGSSGNVGIGTTAMDTYKLNVNGSLNATSLYLNGSQVTSTAAELNYLDGTTVTNGGVMFGNGTYIAQDAASFFWDDSNNRLGIGTTAPNNMLEIMGTSTQLRLAYDSSNYTTLGVGSDGTLTISDSGTQVATFSSSGITLDQPTSFTAAGDVSLANDLQFTNQTASYIKSNAPLYIQAGESFESNSLILQTYNSGNVIADFAGTGYLELSGTDTSIAFNTKSSTDSDFWAGVIDNADNTDNDLFSIGKGTPGQSPYLTINSSGSVGIGTTNPSQALAVNGRVNLLDVGSTASGNNLYANGTDLYWGNTLISSGGDASLSSLTSGYLPYYDGSNLEDSILYTNGTSVGIGTTNPSVNFQIDNNGSTGGTLRLSKSTASSSTLGELQFANSHSSITGQMAKITVTTGSGSIGTTRMSFWTTPFGSTNPLQRMVIFENGNVGIGATNPLDLLSVGTNSEFTVNSLGHVGIGVTANNIFALNTNGSINAASYYINGTQITSTATELNYLDGTTVTNGGIVYGDGTKLAQDASSFFWDATNNRLGIGTTAPNNLLEILGTSTQLRLAYDNSNYTTLGVGSDGTLTISDSGTQVATFSKNGITLDQPTSFTAAGDVSIANDLQFTNQTVSYIKSNAPLVLQAGESFESNNLTLQTYNSGKVVLDAAGGVALNQAQNWDLASSTTALNIESGLMNFDTTNSRIGIGTTNPLATLNVNGTTWLQAGTNPGLFVNSNGNVGIGTTNPSNALQVHGTIYSAATSGTSYGSLNANVLSLHNSATNKTFSINNNLGSTFIGTTNDSHSLILRTSSSINSIYVDESNKGSRVGIFTTTPAATLDVAGTAWLRGSTAPGGLYVNSSGSVGIGTTNPSQALAVNGRVNLLDVGSTASGNNLYATGGNLYWGNTLISSGGDASLSSLTSGYLPYYDGSNLANSGIYQDTSFIGIGGTANTNPFVYVNNSGSVGIGSSSPSSRFTVSNSGTNSITGYGLIERTDSNSESTDLFRLQSSNSGGTNSKTLTFGINPTEGASWAYIDASRTGGLSTNLDFRVTGTSRMVINTSGNVGIGTTSPSSKLDILSTSDQLRLSYDTSNYVTLGVDSGGKLTISDSGTQVATFSSTGITLDQPTAFTAAGDVSIANDLQFTNQTASFIKSNGPLTIQSGESYENLDLTLDPSGTGNVVISDNSNLALYSDQKLIFNADEGNDTFIAFDSSNDWLEVWVNAGVGNTSPNVESLRIRQDGNIDASGAFRGAQFDVAEDYPTVDGELEAGHVVSLSTTPPSEGGQGDVTGSRYMVERANSNNKDMLLGIVSTKPGFHLGGSSYQTEVCSEVKGGGEDEVRKELIMKELRTLVQNTPRPSGTPLTGETSKVPLSKGEVELSSTGDVSAEGLYENYKDYLTKEQIASIDDRIGTCKALRQVPVALAGRVPVKVDGNVKAGDLLTASTNKEGYATKANGEGWVIGRALEDSKNDTVMTFVNLSYFDGKDTNTLANNKPELDSESPLQTKNLEDILDIQISGYPDIKDSLSINADTNIFGNLNIVGDVTGTTITAIDSFRTGLLSISNDNSINVLADTLKLQNKPGAGNVDIFNGKLVLTTSGDIKALGNIEAKKVSAEQFVVKQPAPRHSEASAEESRDPSSLSTTPLDDADGLVAGTNSSAGRGIIPAGSRFVEINTTAIQASSLVLVTPETAITYSLAVTEKVDGVKFKVEIPAIANKDIKFNWLVVGVE